MSCNIRQENLLNLHDMTTQTVWQDFTSYVAIFIHTSVLLGSYKRQGWAGAPIVWDCGFAVLPDAHLASWRIKCSNRKMKRSPFEIGQSTEAEKLCTLQHMPTHALPPSVKQIERRMSHYQATRHLNSKQHKLSIF